MNCNICGKPSGDIDLCNQCLSIASIGTYVVCVNCDKVALTIFGPNLSQRTYYCTKCRTCTGQDIRKKPLDVYCTEEEAKKKLNQQQQKEGKNDRQINDSTAS